MSVFAARARGHVYEILLTVVVGTATTPAAGDLQQ
jgi:hypothetical protein